VGGGGLLAQSGNNATSKVVRPVLPLGLKVSLSLDKPPTNLPVQEGRRVQWGVCLRTNQHKPQMILVLTSSCSLKVQQRPLNFAVNVT